ncbi:MAG: metallophosphoesterase [Chthoniobacterales bacterium]
MIPEEASKNTNYRALADRLGYDLLRKRIQKQAGLWGHDTHPGQGFFVVERFLPIDFLAELVLRLSGLYHRAYREFLDIQLYHNEVFFPDLPTEFDGFRLLQLSDLHIDIDPALSERICGLMKKVDFDLCVLTGDFHHRIARSSNRSLSEMKDLIPLLGEKPLGVLGNHDFIEKVAFLEHHGLRILMNENIRIERGGSEIWICGVDDPHFFRTEDLLRAKKGTPPTAFRILLSHSPEPFEQAAMMGYHFMLAGHTHGGQICLPGGYPLINNARSPRRVLAGPWREQGLQGYTSRGTGACGLPCRLNCPPEITLHTLRRKVF